MEASTLFTAVMIAMFGTFGKQIVRFMFINVENILVVEKNTENA